MSSINLVNYLEIITEEVQKTMVKLSLQVDARHLQPYGIMHGGVSGVLIETACSLGANAQLDTAVQHAIGVDLSVNHLKAVTGGKLNVIATPDRIGRTIQVWQATITNERHEKIAVGRCTLTVGTHDTPAN